MYFRILYYVLALALLVGTIAMAVVQAQCRYLAICFDNRGVLNSGLMAILWLFLFLQFTTASFRRIAQADVVARAIAWLVLAASAVLILVSISN